MTTPPGYLCEFLALASRLCNARTYEQEMVDRWQALEKASSELTPAFDILSKDARTSSQYTTMIDEFISFLYKNEDSTPEEDFDQVVKKDAEYGGSWHKRGGTGAFHALARKGDRIATQIKKHVSINNARSHEKAESIDDTIGDLRRYLLLIRSWHLAIDREEHDRSVQPYIAPTMSFQEQLEDNEMRRG